MLDLVKRGHGKQTRGNQFKTPYWHHCYNVATTLEYFLRKNGELNDDSQLIVLAAYAHDLYEDTDIDRQEIVNLFGQKVDDYIFQVTNELSDAEQDQFMAKLLRASDEAKLIKLADALDNTMQAIYSIDNNGLQWNQEFLQPILEKNQQIIARHIFEKYTKTARDLVSNLDFSYQLYLKNLNKY